MLRLIEARNPRALPEPYRAWTDPEQPLPEGMTHVAPDTMVVLVGGLATVIGGIVTMGGVAILDGIVADTLRGDIDIAGLICGTPVAIGFVVGGVWGYRAWLRHIRWRRAKRDGRLREGLLIGDDATLVWMPGVCHLIPRDACVDIRCEEHREGKTTVRTLVFDVHDPDADPTDPDPVPRRLAYPLIDFNLHGDAKNLEAKLRRWARL